MTTIILDAGHGPNTAGKRSPDGKIKEFHFNHAVVLELTKLLNRKQYEVLATYDSTTDTPLAKRIQRINSGKGAICISIHANAFTSNWHPANGIETYTKEAASKKEKLLAKLVQKSLAQVTGLKDRGVKQQNFYVLKHARIPAILVECGFMTNKREATLLATTDFQKDCAAAIFIGILAYLEEVNKI